MITFQKSLAAALLSGAIAVATPVLAGGLVLAQAQTTTPSASGSATTSGSATAQPAGAAAGVNAAGAAKVSPDSTKATGAYGGMGTDQSTIDKDTNKAKNKATSPMSSPNNMSSPDMTTQPH